jgi:phage tail P2-like protein
MGESVSDISLLPPNATKLERDIEATGTKRLAGISIPIRDLWNPDTCPTALLPWLAWAYSVDTWISTWTEAQQRAYIKNSLLIHKYKGTVGALSRAMSALGYEWRLVEWFEEVPPAEHHTFRIEIGIPDTGITADVYTTVEKIVSDVKNVRSQMSTVVVYGRVDGVAKFLLAQMSGCEDEIQPYMEELLEHLSQFLVLAATIDGEKTFIIPDGADPGDFGGSEIWSGGTGVIDPAAFTFPDGTYPDGGIGPIDQSEYEIVGVP